MYAKVFTQIYDSSIVERPDVRFTFMDLLVLADKDGVVDMTHEAIARRTNRPLEVIRQTIAELEAPDPQSRTPDAKGARLKRLDAHRDWGWLIINFDHFRKIASEDDRKAKTRARVVKYREKTRKKRKCNQPVTHGNAPKRMKRHTDTEAYTEAYAEEEAKRDADAGVNDFDVFWKLWPKKKARAAAEKAFGKALKKTTLERLLAAVRRDMASVGWTKNNGQYIPYAASWLNGERWNDEGDPPDPNLMDPNAR